MPSIPANAVVFEGGTTTMRLGRTRGTLDIAVEVRRAPGSAPVVTVKYQRNGPCKTEPIPGGNHVVNCPVLWTKQTHPAADAFVFDPMLASASLTDTLRGLAVRVTWTALRPTERQVNENGNLSLEQRDAVGDIRWGKDRYTEPKTAQVPSGLYRRIPAPVAP